MMEEHEIVAIKQLVSEFFQKMTIPVFDIPVTLATVISKDGNQKDIVQIFLNVSDPQVMIGHNGKTLAELERILRIILNKKLQKDFYISMDINDYRAKKTAYLKDMADAAANQVAASGQERVLPPMSAFERRIVHNELSLRQDVVTQSNGEGEHRSVIIKPR